MQVNTDQQKVYLLYEKSIGHVTLFNHPYCQSIFVNYINSRILCLSVCLCVISEISGTGCCSATLEPFDG